jgi:DNA-binding transcriptional ArsR family regulator
MVRALAYNRFTESISRYYNIPIKEYFKGVMATAPLDAAALESVAGLFRVLADPTRLAILQALRPRGRTVGDLVATLAARQANVSKQLGVLYDAGLLSRERAGHSVTYAIADPLVFDLCELVCGKLKRDAERELSVFTPRVTRRS